MKIQHSLKLALLSEMEGTPRLPLPFLVETHPPPAPRLHKRPLLALAEPGYRKWAPNTQHQAFFCLPWTHHGVVGGWEDVRGATTPGLAIQSSNLHIISK